MHYCREVVFHARTGRAFLVECGVRESYSGSEVRPLRPGQKQGIRCRRIFQPPPPRIQHLDRFFLRFVSSPSQVPPPLFSPTFVFLVPLPFFFHPPQVHSFFPSIRLLLLGGIRDVFVYTRLKASRLYTFSVMYQSIFVRDRQCAACVSLCDNFPSLLTGEREPPLTILVNVQKRPTSFLPGRLPNLFVFTLSHFCFSLNPSSLSSSHSFVFQLDCEILRRDFSHERDQFIR